MIEYKPNLIFKKDNYNLNYAIKGKGTVDIVLLHGFGLSTYSWVFVENKFDLEKFRLILIDLKGSGFSDKPKNGNYTIRAQAEIVLSLLSYLEIEKFNLIAHSYGGIVALYLLYLKNGTNIPKAILVDTPGFGDTTPFFIKALKNPFLSFISLKLFSSRFLARKIIKQTFYNHQKSLKKLLKQYTFFHSIKNNDRAIIQMAEQLVPENLDEIIDNYKNVKSEILIVWGAEDKLIDVEKGKKLNSKFKNSQMVIIPECGHVPHEEKPTEFYEAIIKFLN
jgi:pimeloyl-ACP methyl ester carboxylesterase